MVHQSRTPHEWSRWPQPSNSIRSSPTQDLAVDPARHLVAGDAARVGVGAAVGLPLEVEPERHPVTPQVAVHLGRIVDADREGLAADGEVVERRLDRVVGPQPLGADLERAARRDRRLVVDHGHQRTALPDDAGPVPGSAPARDEVRVQAESHVAAERSGFVGPVEVPGLVPELLGPRLVPALVGGFGGHASLVPLRLPVRATSRRSQRPTSGIDRW